MAQFTPLGVNYGVNDETLTRMYNPGAMGAGINSVTPWNSVEDFHQSTVGTLFNSSQTPTTAVAAPKRTYDWSAPAVTDTFNPLPDVTSPVTASAPMTASAASPMYSGSNFNPIGGGGSNPAAAFSTEALAARTAPITNATGTVDAAPNSMFAGIGEMSSDIWEGIGGWEGLQSGIQTATGVFQAFQGMQALDLAESKFNFQKDAWQANFNMQKDAYDRQVAQVQSRKDFLARSDTREENQ